MNVEFGIGLVLATIADAVIPGTFWQNVIGTIDVICAGEQLAHY